MPPEPSQAELAARDAAADKDDLAHRVGGTEAEDDDKDLIAELLTAQNERITALESGFANFAKEVKDFFTLKPAPAAAPAAAPKATETVVKPAAEAAKEVAQKAKHGAGLFW